MAASRVGRAGQVVALVEDEQAEAVAPAFEVDVGRVVGGDGQRLDVVVAAAEQADRDAERRRQLAVPLVQQVDRRRDDQGRAGRPCSMARMARRSCRCRSAARRRRGRRPSTTSRGPRSGAGTGRGATGSVQVVCLVVAGVVLVGDLLATQVLDDRPVVPALGAVGAGARVEARRRAGRRAVRPGPPVTTTVPPSKARRMAVGMVMGRPAVG